MRERRLRLSKIGNVGVWTAVLLGLLVVGGSSVWRKMIEWLYAQPTYALSFRDIELDPTPPKWIKSGRVGLLEQVRAGRPNLAKFSAAQLDLDNLNLDFKKLAWVTSVRAKKAYPNKVTVTLGFREPVARIAKGKDSFYYLDADSVVLPEDDIALDDSGRLFDITAEPPRETPKPGLVWPVDHDAPKNPKLNTQNRMLLAAKLAGFLKKKTAGLPENARPAFLPVSIYVAKGAELYVNLESGAWVVWSGFESEPSDGEPKDEEKWNWLVEQGKTENGLVMESSKYLDLRIWPPQIRMSPKKQTVR